jgi:hypothetical protein
LGIEKVLSKALWRYVETNEADPNLRQKAEARFSAQLNCSSCQGLGIKVKSVEAFVVKVLNF